MPQHRLFHPRRHLRGQSVSAGSTSEERALSDVPLGEGWWIASDGNWYPPAAHPDALVQPSSPAEDGPPLEGWWKASDGNWYAPELHPENIGRITLPTATRRTAVTARASLVAARGSGLPEHDGALAVHAGSAEVSRTAHGDSFLAGSTAKAGGLTNGASPVTRLLGPDGRAPVVAPAMDDLAARGIAPKTPLLNGATNGSTNGANGAGSNRRISSGVASKIPGPQGPAPRGVAPKVVAPPPDLDFDPMQDPATLLGEWHLPAPVATPGGTPAAGGRERPFRPGFGKSTSAPPGSTIRAELTKSPFRQPATSSQMPRADGFDEWLESFAPVAPVPRSTKVSPPPQRLMGVADVLSSARLSSGRGAHLTPGGPAYAVPKLSPREADFFVLKPSNKRPKAVHTKPRSKLSGAIFIIVVLLVLIATAAAVLYLHVHH